MVLKLKCQYFTYLIVIYTYSIHILYKYPLEYKNLLLRTKNNKIFFTKAKLFI